METKSIILLGVFTEGSTNIPQAEAFIENGFGVIPVSYRNVIKEYGGIILNNYVIELVKNQQPYMILFSKCNEISPFLISECNKYTKTFYWMMDNIDVAKAIKADEFVKISNYASATSSDVVRWFENYNEKSYHIFEGLDKKAFFYENLEKEYDILFFGSATVKRIELLKNIKNVTIFGNGWPAVFNAKPPIFNSDLRNAINKSKIVLNFVHGNIFSDRIFTCLGCKAFVISEYCKDLECFIKGKHLEWFTSIEELNQIIEKYINNDTAMNKIAEEGQSEVLTKYTWSNTINHILEKVNA
jgi:hypothetical protein